jgi:hypothetical protein
MSARAILPGGLIAGLLTVAAVLALVVALGIRGEGPLALGIGDADGSARLDGGGSATLGRPTPGIRETAPVVLPGGSGVAAPAAGTPSRRDAGLRGSARRGQDVGRRGATRRPAAGPAPAAPDRPAASSPTTTRPAPASTPGPAPAKARDRGTSAPKPAVTKQRAAPAGSATPVPVPITPVPAPTTPQLDRSGAPAPSPASTPAGPPITRVPPPSATP